MGGVAYIYAAKIKGTVLHGTYKCMRSVEVFQFVERLNRER